MKILIMAGGTGGHVFPGLAVARNLQERGVEVAWLGTYRGLENGEVPKAGLQLFRISITGLRGKGFLKLLLAPLRLTRALLQALCIVYRFKPDVVLGMGGFVTGPGGIAAWLLRKRLVIHEQNAIMGMTNKILSRFASRVLTGFPLANKNQFLYVGNPIRAEIINLPAPQARFTSHSGPVRLLVVGGSQGSLSFNKTIPQTLAKLPSSLVYEVLHYGGLRYCSVAKEAYKSAGIENVRVEPFVANIAEAYAWADLIICRAGALTVAELSVVGLGAIIVPFPYAVDDHQTANAKFLVEAKAAVLMPQAEFKSDNLAKVLGELLKDRTKLLNMAQLARKLGKIDATRLIVKRLLRKKRK
jgi:UDP-N-acetylglucosamine--N-acetylmuramyl-(pentapeptide) pyrophosphoryl-undecaprenol N-acetylglucosamine transferase